MRKGLKDAIRTDGGWRACPVSKSFGAPSFLESSLSWAKSGEPQRLTKRDTVTGTFHRQHALPVNNTARKDVTEPIESPHGERIYSRAKGNHFISVRQGSKICGAVVW